VRVVFRKGKRDLCLWVAYPPKRRPVTAVGGPAGRGLPHDLLQLLVERELGHRHGFWGCLAHGATFRSLVPGGRRRTPQGKAVIARHVADLDAAERDADAHARAWLHGLETSTTPILDDMRERWLALAEGGGIELDFHLAGPRRARLPADAREPRSRPPAGGR
jgi:hypothetical protein